MTAQPQDGPSRGSIEIRNCSVLRADGVAILDDISVSIAGGESVAFIGRSGAGKTTALRLINALQSFSGGDVLVDGESVREADVVALRRRVGYILQAAALFPHRTVFDNVATVPRLLGWAEERVGAEVASLLADLGLPIETYGQRFPRRLSGGEQQRVAIARALVFGPEILLCDEPFSALDPIVRREQQETFIQLRETRGVTVVFVTHDLQEALTVAERLVQFEQGRIVGDLSRGDYLQSDVPIIRRFVNSSRFGADWQ